MTNLKSHLQPSQPDRVRGVAAGRGARRQVDAAGAAALADAGGQEVVQRHARPRRHPMHGRLRRQPSERRLQKRTCQLITAMKAVLEALSCTGLQMSVCKNQDIT